MTICYNLSNVYFATNAEAVKTLIKWVVYPRINCDKPLMTKQLQHYYLAVTLLKVYQNNRSLRCCNFVGHCACVIMQGPAHLGDAFQTLIKE